ncbi:MAG TPA: branched-chain amino acid ABC transporter permease [Symbiobacteriaceae bacterium]|nr:branched-chain amino acid ABC transporter permease [Symbiobacteriaceae bacterium]
MSKRYAVAGFLPTLGAAVALAVLLALPGVLTGYWMRVAAGIFMYAAITQGLNLIVGYTGYAAFGNVVYFGLGGYVTGVTMVRLHFSFFTALAVAGLVCGLYAVLVGLPVLRLRGHYFAMATLGVSLGTREMITNLSEWTGGGKGFILPLMSAPPKVQSTFFYFAMLALAIAATLVCWLVARSRWGYGLKAIREDEEAARVLGIPAIRYKILAWAVSAVITGLAGGIYAYRQTFIEPPAMFDVLIMLKAFTMLLLGGMGTVIGPVMGGFLLEMLSDLIWGKFLHWHLGILGMVIMAITLIVPGGLIRGLASVRERLGGGGT